MIELSGFGQYDTERASVLFYRTSVRAFVVYVLLHAIQSFGVFRVEAILDLELFRILVIAFVVLTLVVHVHVKRLPSGESDETASSESHDTTSGESNMNTVKSDTNTVERNTNTSKSNTTPAESDGN